MYIMTICLMHYFFSTKLSNCLSIKTGNTHKIFNELKSVFIFHYIYSGYLNSGKFFPDVYSFCAKHNEYKFGNSFIPCPKTFGSMN